MMYQNLIYVEEYDIYQYFDGYNSFFSHNIVENYTSTPNESDDGKIKTVAVISKNIKFSSIPEKRMQDGKKKFLGRYIVKTYKNESYFLAQGINGEYGVYHTLPVNIKKYYSLFQGIDIVIPYDYLVIEFLKERFKIDNLKKDFLFIEKTDDIYKMILISKGFGLLPVLSFNADMLVDNINILKSKIDSENDEIKIEQIIANCGHVDFKNFLETQKY